MNLKYKFGKTSISRTKGIDARLIILATSYMCTGKRDIGMIIDFIAGVMKGIKTELSRDKCYDEIIKKVTMFLIL